MSSHNGVLISILLLCLFSKSHGAFDFNQLAYSDDNSQLQKNFWWSVLEKQKNDLKNGETEFAKEDELTDMEADGNSRLKRSVREDSVVPYEGLFALDAALRIFVPRTCLEWRRQGFSISGRYHIDPDGPFRGDMPFSVYCNMETGTTEVRHDNMGPHPASYCHGPECFHEVFNYAPSDRQLESLMWASADCSQAVKIDCMRSPFETTEGELSWWKGRNGLRHYEWAGQEYPYHTCECGLRGTCVNSTYRCNCDADLATWETDHGYLTNEEALPVKEVTFGSKDQFTTLQINYTIGPLECAGSRLSSHPTSCHDLALLGHIHSGWYFVGGPQTPQLAFCNMESPDQSVQTDGTEPLVRYLQSNGFSTFRTDHINLLEHRFKLLEQELNMTSPPNSTFFLPELFTAAVGAPHDNCQVFLRYIKSLAGIIRYELSNVDYCGIYSEQSRRATFTVPGHYKITVVGIKGNDVNVVTKFTIYKNHYEFIAEKSSSQGKGYQMLSVTPYSFVEGDTLYVELDEGVLIGDNTDNTSSLKIELIH